MVISKNNLDYLQIEIFKINPHIYKNIFLPTVCRLLKQTLSRLIHQHFGHVSITRLKLMTRKGLMEGLPETTPELEEPYPICLLTKATKIPIGPTTDVSKFPSVHDSNGFCVFQCLKRPWIYLNIFGYMLCYFIPVWIPIQNQASTY